ncbi:hypothetical protein Efla_003973 [Eimeria flavescens]
MQQPCMKLRSFRALRIGALPGSPFGYEVLVRPAEAVPIRAAAAAAAAASAAAAGDPAAAGQACLAASEAAAAAAEEGRALFICNMPLLLQQQQLQQLFAAFGAVEALYDKLTHHKVTNKNVTLVRLVHVVYEEAAAANRVLAAAVPLDFGGPSGGAPPGPPANPPSCGWGPGELWGPLRMAAAGTAVKEGPLKWALEAAALFRPPKKLKAEVDAFMRNYDLEKDLKKRQRQQQIVDEDGFTLVQGPKNSAGDGETIRGFRNAETSALVARGGFSVFRAQAAGASAGEVGGPHLGPSAAAALGLATPAAVKKRKKQHLAADFYAFQRREALRQQAQDAELRSEQALKTVAELAKKKAFSLS